MTGEEPEHAERRIPKGTTPNPKGAVPIRCALETGLPLADDNRFRRRDLVGNLMSLAALCLGIVSLILSVWWVMTAMPWSNQAASFRRDIATWKGPLQLVLGLITLIFGNLGLKYREQHPNLVGYAGSLFGS